MSFTSSIEKYKSRRDQQRLAKYIGKIKSVLESYHVIEDMPYNVVTEIYEEVRSIVQIAEKRSLSWQKFCEMDSGIITLFLGLAVDVDCTSYEVIINLAAPGCNIFLTNCL